MSECKLVHKGKPLTNKQQVLGDIMDPNADHEVTVTSKSELEAYADQMSSAMNLFQ